MTLLIKLAKTFLPSPNLQMDTTLGYQNTVRYCKKLLKLREWEKLENKLDSVSNSELSLLIDHLVSSQSPEDVILLEKWYDARPREVYPAVVRANYFISWAWDARGTALAESVNQKQWVLFFERLNESIEMIDKAIELNPNHFYAYTKLLVLGMAHPNIDIDEAISAMNQVNRHNFTAQKAIIYSLTERWGGDKGTALDYAYAFCNDEEEGSTFHALIAYAHIESWMDILEEALKARHYFLNEKVINDIFIAYEQVFPNEEFRDDIDSIEALNIFAFCFYLAKRKELVGKILLYLNGRSGEFPWHYSDYSSLWFIDVNYTYSAIHKDVGISKLAKKSKRYRRK